MNDHNKPTFGAYQIHHKPELRKFLDPAFTPYENFLNERPEWREFHVSHKEWLAGTMDRHTYTGFFSWKFRRKARIEGQALLAFAQANPGADCYFINPFPKEIAGFPNMWLHGERCHPGLIETTEKIFHKIGFQQRLASSIHTNDVACYCNFWFATQPFWKAYMDFCLPVYDYIEQRATKEEKGILWAPADPSSDAAMVPFIFERLFTEFLLTEPSFDVRAFRYSSEHLKKRFHKRFIEIYHEAETLKQAHIRNPDAAAVLDMSELNRRAASLYKAARKRRRRQATVVLRNAWDRLSGNSPRILTP